MRLHTGAPACQLCSLLLDLLDTAEDLESSDWDVEVDFQVDQDPHNPVDEPADAQYLLVHARRPGAADRYATYYNPAAADIVCRAPTLQVNSARARELALERIRDCIDNHPACTKPGTRTRLPTRVIDCLHPTAPRLVVSADLEDDTVPYVALSYVWGRNASHCTYLANYEAYLRGIDYAVIPQTIRDAILVAHDLGIRYIWIDAFCIIQDSNEDKTRELVKMGSIYQDAYFTIIASSAASGDAGFLQDRTLPPHFRVPYYDRKGRAGTVCIGRRSDTVCPVAPAGEPVDRRAWCFQEWLLSPRKLMYASDTLRYHCQSSARPVEDSLRAIRTIHSATLDHAFLPLRQAILANPDLAELSSAERFARQCALWGQVVANYTQRLLTQKTDKLLAFAAVAEQFDHGEVPTGILKSLELVGQQGVDDCLRPRPLEYLAPSWAWPSVDGRVITRSGSAAESVRGGGIVETCEVLECNVTLMDKRLPYGRVTDGRLKLRAIVAPACIILDLPHLEHDHEYGEDFYYKLFAPTDELKALAHARITSLGSHTDVDPGIQIGIVTLEESNTEINVPVMFHEYNALLEGRLVAIGWGRFRGDQSLLTRVGEANIYFDSPERPPTTNSWLLVINRSFGAKSSPANGTATGEGLLITRTAEGRFRRFGCWSIHLGPRPATRVLSGVMACLQDADVAQVDVQLE
ncbi:hypothetical protein ONZ51_g5023 [Trametes cubensis]|uniref:Heterokaryon incompatibility domain-containing protein n=1 Tax=Trametes cubensis TaxID=1111947 RepID=A0AAD7TV85_9APHY|nr:hypothetical protein ONZ51_g5023 [Trametes cubensis]